MNVTSQSKTIRAWCFYDWGNSAFITSGVAAILPIYFKDIAAVNFTGSQTHLPTAIWGYTSAIAMLIASLIAIILGPVADARGNKKQYLFTFTLLGSLATLFLAFTGFGDWIWVALLFLIGSIGFSASELFYESLLPHITTLDRMDQVSSKGYALGYVGGGLLLVINVAMIFWIPQQVIPGTQTTVPLFAMKLSFIFIALWWIGFSIPLLRFVPEPVVPKITKHTLLFFESVNRLKDTFSEIRKYKNVFLFLLAFWCYNDGIGTIMKMATIYGKEIGIGTLDLIGALVITQFIGIPFALLFGRLAKSLGTKKGIYIGIIGYIIITLGGYLMQEAIHFWILAGMVGMVQGGTQALSRSLYASMVPKEKSAEFFGFYSISSKLAGLFGPLVFALVAQLFKSSRLGILALLFFFILGGIILSKVNPNN